MKGDLMVVINGYCGVDVSRALYSRMRYFFLKTCPELLTETRTYIEFLNKHEIDFVLTPAIWSIEESAVIAACRLAKSTKAIGVGHGSDAYESPQRFFYIYRHFDYYISPTQGETENETELKERFGYQYPVSLTNPYRYRNLQSESGVKNRKKPIVLPKDKSIVLFVPIVYPSPTGRTFQLTQPFPMEYVSWHRALAEAFSKRKDLLFVWKSRIQRGQNYDPIVNIIGEKHLQQHHV